MLLKGDVSGQEPVLVCMHPVHMLPDLLGGHVAAAMRMIGAAGRGVVVLLRDSRRAALSEQVRALGGDWPENAGPAEWALRDYGIGAQILRDLGVRDTILLSKAHRVITGLEGYGLNAIGQAAIVKDHRDLDRFGEIDVAAEFDWRRPLRDRPLRAVRAWTLGCVS